MKWQLLTVIFVCPALLWANDDSSEVQQQSASEVHAESQPSGQCVSLDSAELELLNALRERRKELDAREEALKKREATVAIAEQAWKEKSELLFNKLRSLEERLELGEGAHAAQQKRLDALLATVKTLSPRKAAPVLAAASPDVAAVILARLAPERAAAILAALPSAQAGALVDRIVEDKPQKDSTNSKMVAKNGENKKKL